jgi:hypothetical protein
VPNKTPTDIPDVVAVMLRGLKKKPGGGYLFCIGGHEFETDWSAHCRCPLCKMETDAVMREEDRVAALDDDERWTHELEQQRPEVARIGLLNFAHERLLEFIDESDVWEPGAAQHELARLLCQLAFLGSPKEATVFAFFAAMLFPSGNGYWKLKLTPRKGRKRKKTTLEQQQMARVYGGWVFRGLKEKRHASPSKTARGLLAAQFKMTDEEMRANIERGQGKRGRKRNRQ